jgi:hypothetical protein
MPRKATGNPNGRPSLYTPELAEKVLLRLAEGELLIEVCSSPRMPSASTVYKWINDDVGGFSRSYARAREVGWHIRAERLVLSASMPNMGMVTTYEPNAKGKLSVKKRERRDNVSRSSLAFSAEQWLLSKVMPKTYGQDIGKEDQNQSDAAAANSHVVWLPPKAASVEEWSEQVAAEEERKSAESSGNAS